MSPMLKKNGILLPVWAEKKIFFFARLANATAALLHPPPRDQPRDIEDPLNKQSLCPYVYLKKGKLKKSKTRIEKMAKFKNTNIQTKQKRLSLKKRKEKMPERAPKQTKICQFDEFF